MIGGIDILIILSLSSHEHGISLHLYSFPLVISSKFCSFPHLDLVHILLLITASFLSTNVVFCFQFQIPVHCWYIGKQLPFIINLISCSFAVIAY